MNLGFEDFSLTRKERGKPNPGSSQAMESSALVMNPRRVASEKGKAKIKLLGMNFLNKFANLGCLLMKK